MKFGVFILSIIFNGEFMKALDLQPFVYFLLQQSETSLRHYMNLFLFTSVAYDRFYQMT